MVKVYLDSDIILNVLCKEEDPEFGIRLWPAPTEILNLIGNGVLICVTSILNLMEIRSVLSRKKQWSKAEIFAREDELKNSIDITIPTWTDHIQADKLQKETFLYPMDCLVLTLAKMKIRFSLLVTQNYFLRVKYHLRSPKTF